MIDLNCSNLIKSFISLGITFYFVFFIITHNEGSIALISQIIVALYFFILAIKIFKNRNADENQELINWYDNVRSKGRLYHLLFEGFIRYGLPIVIIIWVMSVDSINNNNLLSYVWKLIISWFIIGLFFGWHSWKLNLKECKKIGLDVD